MVCGVVHAAMFLSLQTIIWGIVCAESPWTSVLMGSKDKLWAWVEPAVVAWVASQSPAFAATTRKWKRC